MMFKKIAVVVVLALAGFLAFAATRPETYHVERSASIAAPAQIVFNNVDNFRTWPAWSPWDKLDPQMKKTLSGPAQGVGAAYAWEGNKKVGKGTMTITAVQPPTNATYRLEFFEPFAAVATTLFTIVPEGQTASTITWAMDGNNNFAGKIFGIFMNMDQTIGADFEKGLAALKIIAEDQAKTAAAVEAAAKAKADADSAAAKALADAAAVKAQEEAAAAEEAAKGKRKR